MDQAEPAAELNGSARSLMARAFMLAAGVDPEDSPLAALAMKGAKVECLECCVLILAGEVSKLRAQLADVAAATTKLERPDVASAQPPA